MPSSSSRAPPRPRRKELASGERAHKAVTSTARKERASATRRTTKRAAVTRRRTAAAVDGAKPLGADTRTSHNSLMPVDTAVGGDTTGTAAISISSSSTDGIISVGSHVWAKSFGVWYPAVVVSEDGGDGELCRVMYGDRTVEAFPRPRADGGSVGETAFIEPILCGAFAERKANILVRFVWPKFMKLIEGDGASVVDGDDAAERRLLSGRTHINMAASRAAKKR